jgi:hypothetical protein
MEWWFMSWRVCVRAIIVEALVFVAVASLLFLVFLLPPDVKKSLVMTAASPPVTWLTNNYVHESWGHLLGNLGGYFVCTFIYIALIPVLAVLGFDPRWVKRFSVITHLAALTVIPIISSFACLQLVLSRAPQLYLLGFSSSVAAYFGAYAALWVVTTAEALSASRGLWRTAHVGFQLLLQLLLLQLTPLSRYPLQRATWLAPTAPYTPLITPVLAFLLAVKSPRSLRAFFERIRSRVKEHTAFFVLLFLPYLLFAPFMLDSLYPVSIAMQDAGRYANALAHFVSMVAGYASTCLFAALARAKEVIQSALARGSKRARPIGDPR